MSWIWHVEIEDGVDYIEVGVSSITLRMRYPGDSYGSAVMPWTQEVVDFLADAPVPDDLEISFYREDSTTGSWDQVFSTVVDYIRQDIGATRKSLTVAGHRTNFYPGGARVTRELEEINYYTDEPRYRVPFDPDIVCGDTIDGPGGSFLLGYISVTVTTDGETSELAET